MIRVVDDLGREVCLDRVPQRIVSLVPSLTETICDLGRGSLLVGVTRHCCEPAAALTNVLRVGGTKNPDLNRIAAAAPELVIVNVEENRGEDFEALERRGIKTFATFPRSVGELPNLLRRFGCLLDAATAAEAAARELEETIGEARGARPPRPVGVFCPIWKNPWMTFNRDTFGADVLESLGAHTLFRHRKERYFEISLAEVAKEQPSAILLPDEPYVFSGKDIPALAPLESTPALQTQRIYLVDGKALFWFGTRTAAALISLGEVVREAR